MKSTRRKDTQPERTIRSLLHAAGLRYRLHKEVLPGLHRSVDIVFGRARVAVFIDGCFWHGCPDHGTASKSNIAFWQNKIEMNRERDADTNRRLEASGWLVVRVWEHESADAAAARIAEAVRRRLH